MKKSQKRQTHTLALAMAAGTTLTLNIAGCSKKKASSTATAPTSPSVTSAGGGGSSTGGSTINAFALSGSVASTAAASSSSSSSLALAAGDTIMSCMIVGDVSSLQTAIVDPTTGAFSFTVAQVGPFAGHQVSCSITLPDGSVNVLKTFSVAADDVAADVSATYDSETGAVTATTNVTGKDGSNANTDEVYAPLPADQMAFDPTPITGEYGRKTWQLDTGKRKTDTTVAGEIRAVKKGDLASTGFDAAACTNCWNQQGLYLRGEKGVTGSKSPVVQDTPPTLSMWNRKADYDACYPSGVLTMSISDGTHSFAFGNGSGILAGDLYTAIVTNGWAPQAAIDQSTINSDPANAPADPQSAQVLALLTAAYPTNPCAGFGAELVKDWSLSTVGIMKVGGHAYCDAKLVYHTSATGMNDMLNQEIAQNPDKNDGGLRDQCGEYKRQKTDAGRTEALGKFVTMCSEFLAGKPGQQNQDQAKVNLVGSFLDSISQLKWQTGDTRFDDLKTALKGLDFSSPATIAAIPEAQLLALAKAWMPVAWDWRERRILELSIGSMDTAIANADNWITVATSTINGMTGQAAIQALLGETQTRTDLDRLVCANAWQMPSLKYMIGDSTLTAITAQLAVPTQDNNFQQGWLSSFTDRNAKKTLATAFITQFLTKQVNHCESVNLGSTLQGINTYDPNNQNNGGFDPLDQFPMQMFGGQLMNAEQEVAYAKVGDDLHNGASYAALKADVAMLAGFNMGGQDYLSQEVAKNEQQYSDDKSRLYLIKQMLGDAAARSAFQYDDTYHTKMQAIKTNSGCLPDAKINYQASTDANGNNVYNVIVNGPVAQVMKAPLTLQGDTVRAVDTQLQNGGSCYWGNVNGFTAIPATAFASTAGFTAPYMMAWFNGCGSSSSSSSGDSLNGMFGVSVLAPVSNQ